MTAFRYQVAPKAKGGFTTRADLGSRVNEATIVNDLVRKTGVEREQCQKVAAALFETILERGGRNERSETLFDAIKFQPVSGGSTESPVHFTNATEINAGVSVTFTRKALESWRKTLNIERTAEVGLVTPIISTIVSEENGEENRFKPGTLIRLRGSNLRFDKNDESQGVFFIPAAGDEVRAAVYGPLEPSEAVVLVPDSLTGPLTVRIASFINSSVRSYEYTNEIIPIS